MKLAVEEAKSGIRMGQTPHGACLVKDDEVVSAAHSTWVASNDVTAHAEVNAVREACRRLNTLDLSGAVVYCTAEPCPMCFIICHLAKVSKIVFGTPMKESQKSGFTRFPALSAEQIKQLGGSGIEIVGGVLYEECKQLFREWSNQNRK